MELSLDIYVLSRCPSMRGLLSDGEDVCAPGQHLESDKVLLLFIDMNICGPCLVVPRKQLVLDGVMTKEEALVSKNAQIRDLGRKIFEEEK